MAESNGSPMDAVSALLEERQRFESWIATLESRKASTPPHVYARVHADYERRLVEVLDHLSSRTGELEELTRDLRLRIDRMQEEENARRDERAEAELRAMVGEYTDDQWTDLRAKSDAEIARLSSDVGSLREELGTLEELLRTATAPRRSQETEAVAAEAPKAPAPAPAPAAAASPAAEAPRAAEPAAERAVPVEKAAEAMAREVPRAPEPAPAAAPATRPDSRGAGDRRDPIPDTRAFDELAFLKSVVEPRDSVRQRLAESPAAQAPAPAAPAQAAAPSVPVPEPRAEPRAEPRTEPRTEPREIPQPQRTTVPGRRPGTPPESTASVPPAHLGADSSSLARESVPTFLRDVPNEQAKTLKCQECGTMNYPTEWYCERCGGELAAM